MPAMYRIVHEDGTPLKEWPEPVTFGEAEAICRGEWALGVAAYMTPATDDEPDTTTDEEGGA